MSRSRDGRDDYYLAGWRVRAEFDIQDLFLWTGEEKQPDIVIRTGAIPDRPDALVLNSPLLQIAGDGSCWFEVPGAARFFVDPEATEVIVAARGNPDDSAVRTFLLGTVFGILCHKRGLLPMHGSCVEIGGRAVVFTGPSGSGKSLLAAALMKAGCAVLSDDIVVVDTNSPGAPVALPSFPRLRLWRDSLDALELDSSLYKRTRPELEKYDLPSEHAFDARPRRFAGIYHLRRDRKESFDSVTRLQGARAVRDAGDTIYRAQVARALGSENAMLRALTAFCAATPAHVLACQPGFGALSARVAALVAEYRGES